MAGIELAKTPHRSVGNKTFVFGVHLFHSGSDIGLRLPNQMTCFRPTGQRQVDLICLDA